MDADGTFGESPGEEGAAIDGVFKPVVGAGGGIEIEKDFYGLLLLTGELADLEVAGVGGGFPIDVAGAFEGFVGADAVEIATEAAVVGFDFAADAGEEILEAGLRIEGGINQDFAAKGDADGFFQESEGEAGGEREAVLAVRAAAGEAHGYGLLNNGASGDDREVDRGGEYGRCASLDADDVDGKRRHPGLGIADVEMGGDAAAGGDVLRKKEIEFQAGQTETADEAGDHESGEHGRQDQEEQVVGGNGGGGGHYHDATEKEQAAAGDAVPHPAQQ